MPHAGNRCSTSIFRSARRSEAKHFVLSISPRTIDSTWTGSRATTGFATFSHRAVSGSPREAQTTPRRLKQWTGKNDLVNKIIEEKGVEPYDGSVELIHQLRDRGFKIAVVTSSQNCTAVLKAAKLDHFFDVQVDGNVIHAQHLAGKPAPDTYLMAAKLLGVEPARAVVIEDALSGVEAGSNGKFGLVIGVARKGNADELRRHGANLVVNDLGELAD